MNLVQPQIPTVADSSLEAPVKMRGIAVLSHSGSNKDLDLYCTTLAGASGAEIDMDIEYLRQFWLALYSTFTISEGRMESEE